MGLKQFLDGLGWPRAWPPGVDFSSPRQPGSPSNPDEEPTWAVDSYSWRHHTSYEPHPESHGVSECSPELCGRSQQGPVDAPKPHPDGCGCGWHQEHPHRERAKRCCERHEDKLGGPCGKRPSVPDEAPCPEAEPCPKHPRAGYNGQDRRVPRTVAEDAEAVSLREALETCAAGSLWAYDVIQDRLWTLEHERDLANQEAVRLRADLVSLAGVKYRATPSNVDADLKRSKKYRKGPAGTRVRKP